MKTFIVTYDFTVYKPSSLTIYDRQNSFSVDIVAEDLTEAKNKLRNEHQKNPFYFKFIQKN